MGFLTEKCFFSDFSVMDHGSKFMIQSGDVSLDIFFNENLTNHEQQRMCKGYNFRLIENPERVVAAFTLSNDGIKGLPNARKKKISLNIPFEKRYSVYPAVMIGRLFVDNEMHGYSIGSDVLSFIKRWLSGDKNISGCRFLLVESYNKPENLHFYEKNGFQLMFGSEQQEVEYRKYNESRNLLTRLMYFDLIEVGK